MTNRQNITGDQEHDLWGVPFESAYYDSFSFDTEVGVNAETFVEEEFGVSTPPLWKSYRSRSIHHESFHPLLPYKHHYSDLSPASRRRAIMDGRRELMEIIKTMPESTNELSLKDIVDVAVGVQGDKKENGVINDASSDFKTEARSLKLKKKGKVKRGPITRTASMESETFLIKMFFPTSIGPKKKVNQGNNAGALPLKSLEQSENVKEKVKWMKWFSMAGKSITSETTNSRRYGSESNFRPGCWFFLGKKSSTRDKQCIF